MGTPAEELTRNFYAWELRGRGWQAYDLAVSLEPPFREFRGHFLARRHAIDDARRETALSALASRFLGRKRETRQEEEKPATNPEPEPEPWRSDPPLVEMRVTLPDRVGGSATLCEHLLLALGASRYPLSFEILGLPGNLAIQLAARLPDRDRLVHQVRAFFPEAIVSEEPEGLGAAWRNVAGSAAILEFGLAREFMLPLKTFREFRPDPLLSILGALSGINGGEVGLLQVLFAPTVHPWAESLIRSVHTPRGEPFFLDAPELTSFAKEKASHPLYAAVVRVAAKGGDARRSWDLISAIAGGLAQFSDWNELLPLAHEEEIDLEKDLLARTTHRSGFLLSLPELVGLVHLPHESVRLPALRRELRPTKAPPPLLLGEGVALGINVHAGERSTVRLPRDLRMRHVHVVGASGTGKSTLLCRMLLEDIERGEGVGLIDPHGDLIDEILSRFPESRERDLILFDPADEEASLGWNMLHARSEVEKTLLASDLVAVFRRLSTSWGDQMNSVLANAILAFLESDQGGTLLELRRFLVDRDYRAEFLATVRDPEVLYYWQREFPLLKGLPQGPILTRLDTFLRSKLVRAVVTERVNRLDFREIVDGGKVFLVKLAQGAIGEENAALLGSLIVSAFHQAAMSRQDLAPQARRHFFLYLDEFHEVATPSMAALLTGARKYRLGLTLAHQELRQLEAKNRDLASAVLANAATRIVLRMGEEDAKTLERGFSAFTAADLLNLEVGEAIARVERADHDFNLKTVPLPALSSHEADTRRAELVALTRTTFPRRTEKSQAESPRPPAAEPPPQAPPPAAPPSPPVSPPPPPKRVTREETHVAPLGRGGPEHQYLQELVKRWAESNGYRAVIEEEIPGGGGKVDVSLRTDEYSLACEISVTSTVAQEVGNVLKCLEAGFQEVAVLALKRPRLQKIEAALKAKLSASELTRVHFLSPEELFTMLSLRPKVRETVVGGYKVKVRHEAIDPDEAAARYKALAEVIGKSVRRVKGEKPPRS